MKFVRCQILLSFQHPKVYIAIEEKELYPLVQMLGEIGGFMGLMIFLSVTSQIDIAQLFRK